MPGPVPLSPGSLRRQVCFWWKQYTQKGASMTAKDQYCVRGRKDSGRWCQYTRDWIGRQHIHFQCLGSGESWTLVDVIRIKTTVPCFWKHFQGNKSVIPSWYSCYQSFFSKLCLFLPIIPRKRRADFSMGTSLTSLEVIVELIPYSGDHLYVLVLVGWVIIAKVTLVRNDQGNSAWFLSKLIVCERWHAGNDQIQYTT